ncbi:MAG: GNAT family N-acetyltransferase [Candidatus Hodarchaeales archaeon]
MPSNTVLRKATPQDFLEVKKLSRSVWQNDYLVDFYHEIITEKSNNFFVLESENKEIIGCVNAEIADFIPEKIGYIKTLRVKEGRHNKGIGTYLTEKMLDFFKTTQEVETIYYVSGMGNAKSVRVALKNGFEEVCVWPAAVIDIDNATEFISGSNIQSHEYSNEEILEFLAKQNIKMFNCHWEFYPPSKQLLQALKKWGESKFFLSSKNNFLSLYSFYGKRNRLVANFIGKPSHEAIKELLDVALSNVRVEELDEIRIFVPENQKKTFANIPLMDFSQGKGVRLFAKKLA